MSTNPFTLKAAVARDRAKRLNTPTERDQAMAESFPLGGGFGYGSARSRERRFDASISRAQAAVSAQREADRLTALEAAYERGEVNAQGRAIRTASEKNAERELSAYIMARVRVGDLIDIGGNSPLRVVKVNRVSVITDGGSRWGADEIARVVSQEARPQEARP